MIDPEIIAEALVKQATANSTNLEKKSPFAEYAEKEGYIYIGGREDDVTAVVSYVVPQKN
jgi:protein phosphatase PTC7